MVDNVVLCDVRRQTNSFSPCPINGKEGQYSFMDLRSVKKTASGKKYCYFFYW
jgi:hypothetical protein